MRDKWENTFAVGVGACISKNIRTYFPNLADNINYKVHSAGPLNYYKFSVIQIFHIYNADQVVETIFAKAHRDPKQSSLEKSVLVDSAIEQGRAEFEFHRYSFERFRELSAEYSVVRPLDYVPDFNAILMEKADGVSLDHFINDISRIPEEDARKQLLRCGKWLSLLHNEFEKNEDKPFSAEAYLALLERNLSKLDDQLPGHKSLRRIREKMHRISVALNGQQEKQGRTHGDYKARHIFLSEAKITVIDFGNDLSAISPFMDVAAFLVEIESLGFATFRGHYKKWQPTIRASFEEGYFQNASPGWALHVYMVYYWVKKWVRRRRKLSHSSGLRLILKPLERLHVLPLIHKWYTDPWFISHINTHIDALEELVSDVSAKGVEA